jgi:hypothetical protein
MKDELIIKLTNETVRHLGNAISVSSASHMIPSYNAILIAAQTNHPNHPFLSHLQPLTKGEEEEMVSVAEMTALFAQVSIALESLSGS